MHFARTIAIFAVCAISFTAPAWAGPPLICHAIPIGNSRSLPWIDSGNWDGADPSYDVSHLERDTLALLASDAPANVRMETLRRAAIYSARETGLADALSIALMGRVLDAQTKNSREPWTWFDAGYFAETLRQAVRIYPLLHGTERNAWMIRTETQHVDGVAWMRMGLRLGGGEKIGSAVTIVERATSQR